MRSVVSRGSKYIGTGEDFGSLRRDRGTYGSGFMIPHVDGTFGGNWSRRTIGHIFMRSEEWRVYSIKTLHTKYGEESQGGILIRDCRGTPSTE